MSYLIAIEGLLTTTKINQITEFDYLKKKVKSTETDLNTTMVNKCKTNYLGHLKDVFNKLKET